MNSAMAYVRLVRSAVRHGQRFALGREAGGSRDLELPALEGLASVAKANVGMADLAARAVPDHAETVIKLRGAVGDMVSDCGVGRLGQIESLCNMLEAAAYAAEHPTGSVGELIEALGFVEHYRGAEAADMWREAEAVTDRISGQAGVDYLKAKAEGEGAEWSAAWLKTLRWQVIQKRGLTVSEADSLGVEDFVSVLSGQTDAGNRISLTRDEANALARPILKRNPDITARELKEQVGCSLGMVPKLPAWQAVQGEKEKGRKPHRARSGSKMLSEVDSTGSVAGKTTAARIREQSEARDDELDRLIAEQQSDFEPSPLDDISETEGPRTGPSV